MKIIHIFTELSPLTKKTRQAELNKHFILNQNNASNFIIMPWYNNYDSNSNCNLLYTDKDNNFEVFSSVLSISENPSYLIKPLNQFYPFFNHELNIQTCLIHFYNSLLQFIEKHFDKAIIHLSDFLCAPVSYLIKSKNLQEKFPTLLSLENLYKDINFFQEHYAQMPGTNSILMNEVTRNGAFTAIKSGLLFADIIVLKSKYYAKEIQSLENNSDYQQFFINRSDDIYGIMNGVQYGTWNPQIDNEIQYKYSTSDLSQKIQNKLYLQNKFQLTESEKIPLLFYGTRLDKLHGIEIIIESLPELAKLPIHLIISGTGDEELIIQLEIEIAKYNNIRLIKGFNISLIHEILAASEFIILPSTDEPDGVSFLYALKYGIIPIAHKVGGHRDVIIDIAECIENPNLIERVNGFFFSSYYSNSLIQIIEEATSVYQDRDLISKYQINCMNEDWSWKKAIQQYQVLYHKLWTKI